MCQISSLYMGLSATEAWAQSNKARVSGLSDIAFGEISSAGTDRRASQSICAFAQSSQNSYSVSATGTGPSGAFLLSSSSGTIPYEVEWASSANQQTGDALRPGVANSGLRSSATQHTCNSGPNSNASLIIVVRASEAGSARAGMYSGNLTVTIAPD